MKTSFLALLIAAVPSLLTAQRALIEDFRTPPPAARPYVWWHWMGPNFSLDGITKDLEAMAASGIGGATIFNLTSADALKPHQQPLLTTECLGVVDFKDWPMLNWDWVKDLCRIGVETAAATGQWVAIASSNFCGPQFKGMWRDVEWHRSITDFIIRSPIRPELVGTKLARRL